MITETTNSPAAGSKSPVPPVVLSVRGRAPTLVQRETGFTVVSPYVEQFWLSVLGPTSLALIRYLARHQLPIGGDDAPYVEISLPLARQSLGVGRRGQDGRNGAFFKALNRLVDFGFVTVDQWRGGVPSHVTIATHIHPVPASIRGRWPAELADRHDQFVQRLLTQDHE